MIVVDASALVDFLVGATPTAERLRTRLEPERLAAPHGIDLECASVLRGLTAGGKLPAGEAHRAVGLLAGMPLRRFSHLPLLERIWELRHNAWPYDAAYIALAELLDVEVITLDAKLARIPGIRCTVRNLRDA